MYYQNIDANMDMYSKKFKKNSFILKPERLRGTPYQKQDLQGFQDEQDNKEGSIFDDCPVIIPSKSV